VSSLCRERQLESSLVVNIVQNQVLLQQPPHAEKTGQLGDKGELLAPG
jgi:Ser-tRNA(Ala) deacylase AlaX